MNSTTAREPLGPMAAAVIGLYDRAVALTEELSGSAVSSHLQLIVDQLDKVRSIAILADRAAAHRGQLPRRTPGATLTPAQGLAQLRDHPDLRPVDPVGRLLD